MTARFVALIPAYNAANLVGPVIREAANYVEQVCVIDDGSVDGTGDVAREAGAVVLAHARNRGKGAALKTGFAWALEQGYPVVVTLDADGQHLPSDIPKLVKTYEETKADLIIGGRSHLFAQMLPRRRMANRFSAWIIGKMARALIHDSQSGFRIYSASLLRDLPLRADGFDLESEVIVRAGNRGLRIITTPIDLGFVNGVSTSHYRPLHDTLRIAWTVARTKFFWNREKS